ncbi:peroxisome proliferator-activated receptor gamma coactivator-related protein 1 [Hemicordylus capensis]|uniref:peroxisome proliferator-activated receptor gamma coactivator-related protein 1 n=1 Tax=Hemicordylus capensis TaxID=884348 RepID=UPI0023023CDD|nr:peroxisome proliferator-activated receptor gamma coactivator-related protein 1 [Hemicordylus capensis]
MAALWGGGAGHAGAGGTLSLRGGTESAVGNDLSSAQYLLTEDMRLASLEAETILEAEELLGTMQDYLDSSVISIIEDYSSLTETKCRMDVDNELSLLTAITDILDSTDDESLSPFDTIPDSELLTSPRERDNSSFQRFLSLSMTPPKQDFHNGEDFKEPRICTIMADKVEASPALTLSSSCPKESTASKKPSSKAPWGEWRLFRHKEREPPVLQRSDGEEEEEEETVTDSGQRIVADEEITEASAAKEVDMDLAASDGPCIITPESISLSELVRSMHSYCQPAVTLCVSPQSQPLVAEFLSGQVVLDVVPESGESMKIPVVLQNVEAEPPCKTDCTVGHIDKGAILLAPGLEEGLPADSKTAHLDIELALGSQGQQAGRAAPQGVEDAPPGAEKGLQRSADNQESKSRPGPVVTTNMKVSAQEKGRRGGHTRKNRKQPSEEAKWQKVSTTCRLPSAASKQEQGRTNASNAVLPSGSDIDFLDKQLEKAEGQGQHEPLPDQASPSKENMCTEKELLKSVPEMGLKSSLVPSLESAEEYSFTQHQGCVDPVSTEQEDVQEPNNRSHSTLPANETAGSETSQLLSSSTADTAGQLPGSPLGTSSTDVGCPQKEAKPRPLSLSEYRQRRQQRQPSDRSTKSSPEKRSSSKWPSLPELPTELADLPCLVVPPSATKVSVPGLAKEPEKPADSSSSPAPVGKASAMLPSMPAPAPAAPLPYQHGGVSSAPPSTTPVPIVPPLPSTVGAFLPVRAQVPPTLPPPYLPSTPFLPAPPSSYILSSLPVPSWSPFAPLPTGCQSLPPQPPATEVCPTILSQVPPVPPPTWPPPPVPLPPFGPGLPYTSVEWASVPQPSYWPGIPIPPPMLPIPYRDQGTLVQSPPVGPFPAPSLSEGTFGQQSTLRTPEPPVFRVQSLAATEKPGLAIHAYRVKAPSAVITYPRRVSDPRRQAQPSVAESKAEVTSGSSQASEKLLFLQSTIELQESIAMTQPIRKSSIPPSLGELHSVPPAQQASDTLKSSEEPSVLLAPQPAGDALARNHPVEKACTISAPRETHSASPPQEENSPLAASVPEKLTRQIATEEDVGKGLSVVPSSLTSAVPKKVPAAGQVAKKLAQTWKHQPLISIAQRSRNKEIVEVFINEIGIEASDLSSLLEQFEKSEVKKEASSVAESRDNLATGKDGSEMQHEKRMLDRLQAPELANVAGLTPPATPPHQLWKPLAAISLLGKAESPKGARLTKSLSKPHQKVTAPVHVGSGEHDYCQLGTAQPKEGSRWNVKHNTDITIKPIAALAKQVPEQPATNQATVAARLGPVGTLDLTAACQKPEEVPSPDDAGQDRIQVLSASATVSSPATSESPLLESSLTSPHTEPLDHRTSTPRSAVRGSSGDPCSVLLSPAASPCRDAEKMSQQPRELQQKPLASKRSLRCYRSRQKSTSPQESRWRSRRKRASRSFSSSSDGDSDSDSSSSSSSSSRSRSLSPPPKRWRRYRSRSSSSSSCDSSWSQSRSRSRSSSCSSYVSRSSSRSPSLHRRRSCRERYDSSSSRDSYQRQKIRYKEHAIEERRVVFIGKIPSRMTRSELRHRFSVFGAIEDCTLHFREQGDNYGFVTYRYAEEAFAAIEGGNALRCPDEQPFDLCFGGRRQFCKRTYADLDSNREDFEPAPAKSKFDSLDFDTLLKQAQRKLRR